MRIPKNSTEFKMLSISQLRSLLSICLRPDIQKKDVNGDVANLVSRIQTRITELYES